MNVTKQRGGKKGKKKLKIQQCNEKIISCIGNTLKAVCELTDANLSGRWFQGWITDIL